MANIDVKINNLKKSAATEQSIAIKIQKLAKELDDVAGRISTDSDMIKQVRGNLKKISANVDLNAKNVKKLGNALDEVVRIYQTAEEEISGKKGIKEKIADIIDRIGDEIRDLAGVLGMDGACLYSGDPVNLSNGNYVYEKNIFNFETILPMNLRFFYNVQSEETGVLGKGWMHNFEMKLVKKSERISIVTEDGTECSFVDLGHVYKPVEGTNGQLREVLDGFCYVDEDYISYMFSDDGKLQEISTLDEWKVTLDYKDGKLDSVCCTDQIALYFSYKDQLLSAITDHTGRTVELKYNKGQLCELIDPEGNATGYGYCKDGNLTEVYGPDGTVALKNIFDENKRTVRQDFPDGGVVFYEYDDTEKVVVMTRQNGSKVSYYHDSHFRNTKTVYTDGEELTEYNNNHQRISYTDKAGYKTKYEYNQNGDIVKVTNPLGDTMEFRYNDQKQVTHLFVNEELLHTAEYDEKHHQIISTDANQAVQRFEYDELGRPIVMEHEDGSVTKLMYDSFGNVVFVDDPVAGKTKYTYDNCHRVIRTEDVRGSIMEYEYNKNDLLTKVIREDGSSREYKYDNKGNLIRIKDFNDGITVMEYNAMNKPVKITDADGNTTEYEYDTMWNPVKRKLPNNGVYSYGYDMEGRLNYIQDPMGNVELAEYDAVGNLVKRTAADGAVYQLKYDALRRLVERIDPVGGSKKFSYDAMGNLIQVEHEDGSKEISAYDAVGNRISFTNQEGYTVYFKYDSLKKLTEVSDDQGVLAQYEYLSGGILKKETRADQSTVEYFYDELGNIVELKDSINGNFEFSYDVLGNVTMVKRGDAVEIYTYNPLGNVTSITDGEGNKKEYEYTKAGALSFVRDANGVETAYEYDECYQLKRILQPENGKFDAEKFNLFNMQQKNIRITEFGRDLCGNVISINAADGTSETFTYDSCGRINSKTDGDGNKLTCAYEPDGLEREIIFNNGRSVKYYYNELRQLARIEDWLGTTSFRKDSLGRINEVTDHEGRTSKYIWNGRGECSEIIYPNGASVVYKRNDRSQLTSTVIGEEETLYSYYADGKLKERKINGLFSTKYDYDLSGRIAGIGNYKEDVLLDKYSYEYNLTGRKSRITEFHNQPELISGRYDYEYNAVGSLKSVTRDGELYQQFDYDVFGNRVKSYDNGTETRYEYDQYGRMVSSYSGNEQIAYTYDKRGNLRGKSVNGIQKLALHFDELNRLAEAKTDAAKTVYQYNGLDMLVEKRTIEADKENVEAFAYDYSKNSANLLMVSINNVCKNIAWDNGLLATVSSQGNHYYLNDERMNQVGRIVGNEVIERRTFDPFGQIQSAYGMETERNEFTFSGFQKDALTGYYHCNKRQYDANAGRFISCDPVAGALMVPVTLNAYVYCMSDPVNHYDPTGMVAVWLASGAVGAIANIGCRFAGDVVQFATTGKWQPSSFGDYLAAGAGGFVEGSLLIVAGPAAAGAAGAATETLLSGGIKMVSGKEEVSAESVTGLLVDTAVSATTNAALGSIFNWSPKKVKIPGITVGKGSAKAVWNQIVTKAKKGIIKNISGKTLLKGLLVHGPVRILDTIIDKGTSGIKDMVKEKVVDVLEKKFLPHATVVWEYVKDLFGGNMAASVSSIFLTKQRATCPAAGI